MFEKLGGLLRLKSVALVRDRKVGVVDLTMVGHFLFENSESMNQKRFPRVFIS